MTSNVKKAKSFVKAEALPGVRASVFIGCGIMILLGNIDATITMSAIPEIGVALNTPFGHMQWITTSYFLAAMSLFVLGGRLTDLFGPRPIFLAGVLIFLLSSIAAATSSTLAPLIAARAFQGVGFAFTLSIALLMISSVFPVQKRGFVLGSALALSGIGMALGPIIGGIILSHLSWEWIFWFNIPFSLVSIILIFFSYPADRRPEVTLREIDGVGAALLSFGMCSFLIFCEQIGSGLTWRLVSVGLLSFLFLLFFVIRECRTEAPLFKFTLLKSRNYSLSLSARFIFMGVQSIFLFFVPIFLQRGLGADAFHSGFVMLFFSLAFVLASLMVGSWVDRVGHQIPIVTGSILAIAGLLLCAISSMHTDGRTWTLFVGLSVFGFATGMLIPATAASAMASLPKSEVGQGLGMFFTIAFTGASLAIALANLQFNSTVQDALRLQVVHNVAFSNLNSSGFTTMLSVAGGSSPFSALSSVTNVAHADLHAAVVQGLKVGFSSLMQICALLCGIVLALSLCFKKNE